MIKSQDLRVGNLVYCGKHDLQIMEVARIRPSHMGDQEDSPDFCDLFTIPDRYPIFSCQVQILSGIPLTPEILEKSGFNRSEYLGTITYSPPYEGGPADLLINLMIQQVDGGYEIFASEWTIGRTFHFVHELQNIVYFLFGHEIKVNL